MQLLSVRYSPTCVLTDRPWNPFPPSQINDFTPPSTLSYCLCASVFCFTQRRSFFFFLLILTFPFNPVFFAEFRTAHEFPILEILVAEYLAIFLSLSVLGQILYLSFSLFCSGKQQIQRKVTSGSSAFPSAGQRDSGRPWRDWKAQGGVREQQEISLIPTQAATLREDFGLFSCILFSYFPPG